jgi:hypothetical protein
MRIFYKYHISVTHEDGSIHKVVQRSQGDWYANKCLCRALAALGQIIRSNSRSFSIEIKEKDSGIPAFQLHAALPFLED